MHLLSFAVTLPCPVRPLISFLLTFMHVQGSEFLILASDGIWDQVQNSDAVRRVQRWLGEEGQTVDEAAESLVDYARRLGSNDDVSVVLLRFSSRPLQEKVASRNVNSALRRARSVAVMPPVIDLTRLPSG
jgi:hypothetical protein